MLLKEDKKFKIFLDVYEKKTDPLIKKHFISMTAIRCL